MGVVVTNLGRRLAGVELQLLTATTVRSFCSHTHTHNCIISASLTINVIQRISALGIDLSTQPSTFRGTVKWVLVNARVKSEESSLQGGR